MSPRRSSTVIGALRAVLLVSVVLAAACSHTSSTAFFARAGAPDDRPADRTSPAAPLVLQHTHVEQVPFVPTAWRGHSVVVTVPAGRTAPGAVIRSADPGAGFELRLLGPGAAGSPTPVAGSVEILAITDTSVTALVALRDPMTSWSLNRRIVFSREPRGG